MKWSFVVSLSETSFEYISKDKNIEAVFGELSSLGYNGVELGIRDPSAVSVESLKKLLRSHGLVVPAIGTGQAFCDDNLSFTDGDPKVRARAIERIKQHIELAAKLQSNVIIGLIRGRPDDIEQGREQCLEALKECCEHASGFPDVNIFIEPLNRYETNLVNTIEQAITFIKETASDNLWLLIDTFHMNIEETNMAESILAAGPFIKHVHVADSNRWVPGNGHLDFKEILSALLKIQYDGFISAECLMRPSKEKAYSQNIEFLEGLL